MDSIETCAGRRVERRRAARPFDLRHSEALLISACLMLRDEPSDVISTMTLSLPFDDNWWSTTREKTPLQWWVACLSERSRDPE